MAGAVLSTCIAVRFAWHMSFNAAVRWRDRRLGFNPPRPMLRPSVGSGVIISWAGMRGIVSLAAALALPLTLADGVTPFPRRDLIIFITFGVILVTLVFQGLTLPAVIRWLRLSEVADDADDEEVTARYLGALAAVERLDNLTALGESAKERLGRVRATYDERVAYYSRQLNPGGDGGGAGGGAADPVSLACQTGEQIEREALAAERQMIVRLRDQGVIGDEVLRRIQEEMDHEETRLAE